jgi:isochorismate pyruvate lyase
MRQRRLWAEAAGLNPDVIESMYRLLVDNFIEEELELIRQREVG